MTKKPKRKVRAATLHARAKREGIAACGGYDALMAWQGGVCAICGNPPKPGGNRLCIDHDHRTMQVRGLLCAGRWVGCNRLIGKIDSVEWLERVIAYLKNPPAPEAQNVGGWRRTT